MLGLIIFLSIYCACLITHDQNRWCHAVDEGISFLCTKFIRILILLMTCIFVCRHYGKDIFSLCVLYRIALYKHFIILETLFEGQVISSCNCECGMCLCTVQSYLLQLKYNVLFNNNIHDAGVFVRAYVWVCAQVCVKIFSPTTIQLQATHYYANNSSCIFYV